MGITSLFHLIVFTHHIMCFQSSEMSVVFTKNKGGNGREREGWLLSQEEFLENQGWAPHCCWGGIPVGATATLLPKPGLRGNVP